MKKYDVIIEGVITVEASSKDAARKKVDRHIENIVTYTHARPNKTEFHGHIDESFWEDVK